MDNKSKSDRIFELLPRLLNARADENWSGLIKAIGGEDDRLAQLIEDVRNQFFIKTASRPYLDRLASNSDITRPRFIGMGDIAFRKYVPVLSYQPKQVRQIVDTLLDIFFFKEATTAFLSSSAFEPFVLEDGWSLQLTVDNINFENVVFHTADFSNIALATADEIAAAYNRQAKYSYAINFFDSITKHNYIRIFSNTIGAQGSLEISGGLANIALQLNGFITTAGNGVNTQWNVTKIGDSVTFNYTGGGLPGLDQLQIGDLFLSDIVGNKGSFIITDVDVQNANFKFVNLLATPGSVTQTSANQAKFVRPEKFTAYKVARRALAWETSPGKMTVEMPATPPIVERALKGGFHINGTSSVVTSFPSTTSITLSDATAFPAAGKFWVEPANSISARLTGGPTDEFAEYVTHGRLISEMIHYSYTSKSGNTLLGVSPTLPQVTGLDEITLTSLTRTSDVITATGSNDFDEGDQVIIRNSTGIPILNATGHTTSGSPTLTAMTDITGVTPGQLISGSGIPVGTKVLNVSAPSTVLMTKDATATATTSITFSEDTNGGFTAFNVSSTSFQYNLLGVDGSASSAGVASREKIVLAEDSKVILTTAISSSITKIIGPYVWDLNAPFTLSSNTATSTDAIQAGKIVRLLNISDNTIPDGEGFIVFNYGQNNQEGPVKYLYKASSNILALDPSYTFHQNHDAGAPVVALAHKGPHVMSGLGAEYAPYATNPPDARVILQDLISSVTSAGIFVDFLIRFPQQLYGTISVYD